MTRFLHFIDSLSTWVGKSFGWLILVLTLGVSYEVFVRYVLNEPTSWAFDFSYLMYGAMFFMAGAYTLSRGGHVRADMFYRLWRPRTQAIVELTLYVIFFFPGVLALVIAGWDYGFNSMRIREQSVNSPAGVPIWPLKMLIPMGAGLLALQGFAEVLRCIQCMQDNNWPDRLHDVEELEKQILAEHARKAEQEAAQEAAR